MALTVGETKIILNKSVRAYKRMIVGMGDPINAPGNRPTESEARTWYQTRYPSVDELTLIDRFITKCRNRSLVE